MESALQKLLTLTIIFGESLWKATDLYLDWIGEKLAFIPFTLNSETLIYTYLGTYILSGIAVGFLIIRTMTLIEAVNISQLKFELKAELPKIHSNKTKKKRFPFFDAPDGFTGTNLIF